MLYRIFTRGDEAPAASMRPIIFAMVAITTFITFICVVRVSARHEVLRLGSELSKTAEKVRVLREQNRALSLERATLTSPDRIRKLATDLGMTTVAPDRIRVVAPAKVSAL